MKKNDILQRFLFDGTDIRGEIVTLETSYQTIVGKHNYPPSVAELFGEFIAAASLLSATLKFPGIISIQARGDGPLSTVMAECAAGTQLRGIVRGDLPAAGNVSSLQDMLGSGTLAITIEPEDGERYQGIVPMESGSLSQCLEFYFQQSEQLPTKLRLSANPELAAGILVQQMPRTGDSAKNISDWETVSALLETIKPEEQLSLSHNDQLYLLFHEEEVRLFEPQYLQFFCSCSKQRTESALINLGITEMRNIIEEQGRVLITCQFCDEEYCFNKEHIESLFNSPEATLH
ncbi:Hsp33 family molecular chaperone HslO [SAR92 clade bacterium H921]|jgi:molecular chaperone Hsp33|nr:Hsp33 family molecular chaperone HslO [SAR92 clade bacterium H921]MDG1308517.1 Hsp33 family molecular chaperone HslO [Porticoccaceae bacterium]